MTERRFSGLGIGVGRMASIAEVVDLAREAEALGLHSFWLAEGYHSRSAVVVAGAIAAATNNMLIGLGILSPHTKHPALLAMEAASLDEIAPGRVILGIGRVINALRKHGLRKTGATELVKEAVELTRGLLSGREFRYEGKHFKLSSPGSRLGFPARKELPIYVGATGPAMLTLAGQYADGVLFNYPCTPGFVEYAIPFIREGFNRSGRAWGEFDVAAYLLVSVDDERERAFDEAKKFIADKLPTRHPLMLQHAGVSEEEVRFVQQSVEKLGLAGAASQIDNALVRKVAIAGTPDDVVAGLKRFLGSGLKLPIVWDIIGPDRHRSLKLIAKEVMPKLL